jgi:hypothetical protein
VQQRPSAPCSLPQVRGTRGDDGGRAGSNPAPAFVFLEGVGSCFSLCILLCVIEEARCICLHQPLVSAL